MELIYIYYWISVGSNTFIMELFLHYSHSNAQSDMINICNDYLNVYKVLHYLYQASFSL